MQNNFNQHQWPPKGFPQNAYYAAPQQVMQKQEPVKRARLATASLIVSSVSAGLFIANLATLILQLVIFVLLAYVFSHSSGAAAITTLILFLIVQLVLYLYPIAGIILGSISLARFKKSAPRALPMSIVSVVLGVVTIIIAILFKIFGLEWMSTL